MTVPQNRNPLPTFGQAAFQTPREPPMTSSMFRKEVTFVGVPRATSEESRNAERSSKKQLRRSNSHGSATANSKPLNSKRQVAAIPIFPVSPGGSVDGERPCSSRSESYDSLTSGAVLSPDHDQKNYKSSSSPEAPGQPRNDIRSKLSRSLSLQSWQLASSKVPDGSLPIAKLTKTKAVEPKCALSRSSSLGSPRRSFSGSKQSEKKSVTNTLSRLGSLTLKSDAAKVSRKVSSAAATVPKFGEWDDDGFAFGSDITKRFDNVIKEKKAGRSGGGGKVIWAAELEAYQSALDEPVNSSRKSSALNSKGNLSMSSSKPLYADLPNSNRPRLEQNLDDGKNSNHQRKSRLKVWQDIHDIEVNKQSVSLQAKSKSFNKTKELEDDAANKQATSNLHQKRKSFENWTEQQYSPSIKFESKFQTMTNFNSKGEDGGTKELNSQMVRPTISQWFCCAATAVKA